jgi:multicomponent Na+:H+ antiporter subunit B
MKKRFLAWLYGDQDVMEEILDSFNKPDMTHKELKKITRAAEEEYDNRPEVLETIGRERARFRRMYFVVALISCITMTLVLLYTISLLPRYGAENPRTVEVVSRYVEDGLEETGAVNIVSGMILDYRAFDTLGESHVLFTALICVMILLRIDNKNQRSDYEDYYTVRTDSYFDLSSDPVLRLVCAVIIPCILLYGIYILLNGQNSPGGGFSGGAVLGAGMILFSAAFGFDKADRFFTLKVSNIVTFVSLAFYSFAKGYVFFMGANGLENHIPKGTPGAIFSGGMILPLDIAVGCVVGCTMYGFYSLFRRGSIGGRL